MAAGFRWGGRKKAGMQPPPSAAASVQAPHGKEDRKGAASLQPQLGTQPDDVDALRGLLMQHLKGHDYGAAMAVLGRLAELEPEEMTWRFFRAELHEALGEHESARSVFESILAVEPFSARATQGLAMLMLRNKEDSLVLGMVEDTIQHAEAAGASAAASDLTLVLGQLHTLQGNMEEAIRIYKGMSEKDPNDFRPHLCQGLAYLLTGKVEEAEERFQDFRRLCPPEFADRESWSSAIVQAKEEAQHAQKLGKQQQREAGKPKSGRAGGKAPASVIQQPDVSFDPGSDRAAPPKEEP